MIQEVSGDILLSKAQVLVHGVAPDDHFDSGLALALRQKYPMMYKDFRHYCKVSHPSSGSCWTWGGTGGVRVVSLLTQEPAPTQNSKPRPATMHNVNHALKELAKEVAVEGYTSLALPRLATGYGKLPWEEVRPQIEKHLGGLGIPVVVYSEFHAGVAADEKLGEAEGAG